MPEWIRRNGKSPVNGFDVAPAVISVKPGHIAVGHFADQGGGGAKGIPIQIFIGSGKVGAKV